MDWHHLTRGSRKHPALLFLHGFMGLADDWRELFARLEHDYYCIAPDLPGHGRNGFPLRKGGISMQSVAGDLLKFLDHHKLDQVTLIGYSMGARLALYVALQHPERLRGLVLESGGPGIEDEYERRVRIALDDDRAYNLRCLGIEAFLDEWYRAPLFESLQRHPEKLEHLKKLHSVHNAEGLAEALQGLSTGRQPSLWDKLDRLHLPTLLMTGAFDHKFCRINRIMSESLPRCEWRMIGAAGHNTHLEQPDAYLTTLVRFLQEHVYRHEPDREKHER